MLYQYRCSNLHVTELYRPVKDHNKPVPCKCGEQATQVILNAPMGIVTGTTNYTCPISHERITSSKQRRESFARNGLQDANDSEACPDAVKERHQRARAAKLKLENDTPQIVKDMQNDTNLIKELAND